MPAVTYPHIEIREDGTPAIVGTRITVTHLAMERLAYHWDAEEMRRQHPTLTLGQIHSALAYYYDHEDEINRAIEEDERNADAIYPKLRNPALIAKLQAAKGQRHVKG